MKLFKSLPFYKRSNYSTACNNLSLTTHLQKRSLTKKDITEVVDLALTQIFEGLSEGKTVDLAGFGKFEITERKAREGINPLTKEKIQIEASKSVKFKIAKALKEAVNK